MHNQPKPDLLENVEGLFLEIVRQFGEGLSIVDSEGRYISVNPALCQLTGYSAEELTQKNFYDLLPQDAPRQTGTREQQIRKKDGSLLWSEIKAFPICYNEQNYLLEIVRDITEKKAAEKKLRESEEKFRVAFKTSPDAINLNRLTDGVYIDINEGFTRITG